MPAQPHLTFEDFTAGDVATFGAMEVTREAILAFARAWDPQPFHLDDEAAKASILGGLAASGWHTGCILMRLNCDAWINRSASWGGNGVEELKWPRPVRPGDVLRARRTIVATRASKSRPQMGLVSLFFELLNQEDAVVMSQRNTVMMGLRGMSPEPMAFAARTPVAAAVAVAPLPMSGWYEDAVVGASVPIGTFTFDSDGIKAFAEQFDPQPFHLDEAAAASSHFGGLVASGWHTSAAFMRLFVLAKQRHMDQAVAAGEKVPEPGPSPGVRNLRWPAPVRPGDSVTYTIAATAKRPSSRPGWGLVESVNTGVNQLGEKVFEFGGAVFYQMRG